MTNRESRMGMRKHIQIARPQNEKDGVEDQTAGRCYGPKRRHAVCRSLGMTAYSLNETDS